MPYKFEVANLRSIEEAISASRTFRPLNDSEPLIEADCIHTDTGELCGFSDMNGLCHLK